MKLSSLLLLILAQVNNIACFTNQIVSPLTIRTISNRETFQSFATVKDKTKGGSKQVEVKDKTKDTEVVNGERPLGTIYDVNSDDFNVTHVSEILDDINRRISDGSMELLQNITSVMDEKLVQLPESAAAELSHYIGDLANKIQSAQQSELQRQLAELEARFVRPLEQIAFSDAPLFDVDPMIPGEIQIDQDKSGTRHEEKLILTGANSTLQRTARMRTSEIIRNFNVAPFYYSIALLYRWFSKASYPSVVLLSTYKNLANVIKSRGPRMKKKRKGELSYEEYLKNAEAMQSGWKRTGEIAAKGPLAKKWAILRRSTEIWAYFSSFYLKDRHINRKYQSGKWSEEKYREEKSKLGAEVTQNLLRLGPTFIKVCNLLFLLMIDEGHV